MWCLSAPPGPPGRTLHCRRRRNPASGSCESFSAPSLLCVDNIQMFWCQTLFCRWFQTANLSVTTFYLSCLLFFLFTRWL